MKTFKKFLPNILLILLFLSIGISSAICQDVSFEKVKEICKENTDREERIRVVVSSFKNDRYRRNYADLGPELATMLTNALFEVNCFRVLESASKMSEFDSEFDLGDQGYTNGMGAPKKGNMLGAQVIITGEITEVSQGKKSAGAFGVSVGREKSHVGFVLKVLEASTRDVLFSESVNMDGSANGFNGLSVLNLKVVGSTDRSKSLNNAVEKAIIKATEILAKSKDNWGVEVDPTLENLQMLTIDVTDIEFAKMVEFETFLTSISGVEQVQKSMKDGIGSFNVVTSLSESDLATALSPKISTQYKIVEVNEGKIGLAKK